MFADPEHPYRTVDLIIRKGINLQSNYMPSSQHFYDDQGSQIARHNITDTFDATGMNALLAKSAQGHLKSLEQVLATDARVEQEGEDAAAAESEQVGGNGGVGGGSDGGSDGAESL
eukprot:4054987-Pyramimonas_sp.AAC.1